ncbi:MAG: 16S rRNA (cytidine(1402)-2'-O)-methyltransferase [Alkalispirochaetaceae bacterium]
MRGSSIETALYVVGTPIGNLEDITRRAERVLLALELCACEDTRQSRKLLNHIGASAGLISCWSRNEAACAVPVIDALASGSAVGYLTDAGTPAISDPGARLVHLVREAGYPVVPIPGVSAVTTLISVAGLVGGSFTFDGFLSPKAGRRRSRLQELLDRGESFLLYESPHRVVKLLKDLEELAPEATVTVGRELTKVHEEIIQGAPGEIRERYEGRDRVRGELSLLVSPRKKG